jgi:hypothetical protein
VGQRSEEAVLGLEHFQTNWIEGGVAGKGSVIAFVENMGVFGWIEGIAVQEAKQKVVAVFI